MKNIFVLLSASLAFNCFGGGGEYDKINEFIDMALLQQDSVQFFDYRAKDDKEYRVGAILIDVGTQTVWDILQDMETLGDVLPYLEYQKIRNKDAAQVERLTGDILVEGRFNIPLFTAQYTITMSFDRAHMWRKWRVLKPAEVESYTQKGINVLQTSGLIRNMEGFEYLEAFDGGTKTIYYYALDIQSTIPLPEFVKKNMHETLYDQQLRFIKHRAEAPMVEDGRSGTDIERTH